MHALASLPDRILKLPPYRLVESIPARLGGVGLGLERTVGTTDRRVSGLPALRGVATTGLGTLVGPARLEVDSYRPTVVDEVVEIRLGFDRSTGRLAIADGAVRHEPREVTAAAATSWIDSTTSVLTDPTAAIGSRVDLVA